MPHPFFSGSLVPRVFAHRGLVTPELTSQGIAENTLAAFEAAVAAGAEYLETDCHLSSDGEVVLFHDDDLRRVAGDPRTVSDVSYAELRDIMASRGGVLTLRELLERFDVSKFNVDVKSDAVAEPAAHILSSHGDRVLLASFDDSRRQRAVTAAAAQGSALATSPGRSRLMQLLLAVAMRSRTGAAKALTGVDAVQIPERHRGVRVLSPSLIDYVHHLGLEVHVWTVNDPARMRGLVEMGVDGIITDRADLALASLHAR